MSFDRGWAPAGLSAHNTPRGDVTTAARLARGSSCERANTPWYAPPGVLAFDDDSTHPLLRCEQLIPQRGSEATLPRQVGAYALGDGYVWTVSRFGLERWDLTGVSPVLTATFAALGAKPNANPGAVLAASDTLVAVGLGSHLTVLGAVADGAFASLGGVELCDDVVGLHAGRDDIWAVGKRHVTHVRLADGALAVVGTFELMRLSVEDGGAGDDDGHDHGGHHGDQHQRGDHGDDDDEHEHRHGDHEPGDHGDDTLGIFAHPLAADTCGGTRSPGQVVSASAAGAVLAIAFEHHLVTLDLRKPSRLPTFAWQPFEQKLTDVGTDGRFTYAHTNGAPSWYAFRASPRNALDPTGVEPAHGFAQGRSYRGRYAARLTGVALRVAVGGAP